MAADHLDDSWGEQPTRPRKVSCHKRALCIHLSTSGFEEISSESVPPIAAV
jgi:hypothetical protein